MDLETKRKIADLLRSSVKDFNKFRAKNPNLEIDLSQGNFVEMSLRGVNLSGVQLIGANFTNTDLSGADFSYSNVQMAIFNRARLERSRFDGARMSGSQFFCSNLQKSSMKNIKTMHEVNFRGADLRETDFTGSPTEFCYFEDARFQELQTIQVIEDSRKVEEDEFAEAEEIELPARFRTLPRFKKYLKYLGIGFLSIIIIFIILVLIWKLQEKNWGSPEKKISAFLQYLVGNYCMSLGDTKQAEEAYNQAVQLAPQNPSYFYSLAQSREKQKKYGLAKDSLIKAQKLNPPSPLKEKIEKKLEFYKEMGIGGASP